MNRTARGRSAEDTALSWLTARGLELMERNYRCPPGELDLVMRDGETVVFVEVRYRRNRAYGGAVESIDARKRARIARAAASWLQRRTCGRQPPCRFDVVVIEGDPRRPEIEWIRAAFEA